MGKHYALTVQQATSYKHTQLVSAATKPSNHQEKRVLGTELGVFSSGRRHVLPALCC